MDINQFRAAKVEPSQPKEEAPKVEIAGPPKLLTAGPVVKIKKPDQFSKFEYRGFFIYRSHLTGKWWFTNGEGMLMGWANDYNNAKGNIDYTIDRARKKHET